jgi:excisionase family DNA binding protein
MNESRSPDKTHPITLAEAAEMYGFSQDYLRQLIHKGRLAAQKSGGVWLVSPADVEVYITSRTHRGKYRSDIGS